MREAARLAMGADPADPVFTSVTEAIDVVPEGACTGNFGAGDVVEPDEARARVRLASVLQSALSSARNLRAFRLEGGWGDAIGAGWTGILLVDPARREAIWVFCAREWSYG